MHLRPRICEAPSVECDKVNATTQADLDATSSLHCERTGNETAEHDDVGSFARR